MPKKALTAKGIKKGIAAGVIVLGIKRVAAQLVLTLSNIVLARLLAPEIFGAFSIISFLILTLGSLTSLGLAAALIQKKGQVTKKELRAAFTALILSSLIFALIIYFLTPLVNGFYQGKLGKENIFWLRLFSLGLIFANIPAISGTLLERKLDYKKIAGGELIHLLVTQVLTVIFAWKGLGVGSFVLANLMAGVFNFFLLFWLSPWPIGLNFSFKDLRNFWSFGLNFQANTLIGIVNGAVIPGFVGAVSGSQAVGLVNWAGGVRAVGLAPAEVTNRLIFPACSRAQNKKRLLKSLIERMTQLTCMFSFPLFAAIFALAPAITYIIYTDKWLGGLTALYLSVIQGIFILLGGIFVQVLLALGKAKTVRNISLLWAVLQWVLTVPLVLFWNFNGVVLAGILVSLTFFIPLKEVQKEVSLDIRPHTLPYLAYSVLAGLVMFCLSRLVIIKSLPELLAIGAIGAIFYWGIVLLFRGKIITHDFIRLKKIIADEK